jgi:predicted AAA+ superfamily ATPase
MIQRLLSKVIGEHLFRGKAIVIYGPRQSGKTTLINQLLNSLNLPVIRYNGDEPDIRELLSNPTSTILKSMIGDNRIVFIDEAQRIPDIGISIKLLVDNYPEIQVITTGSSAFELTGKIKEPLTGRKFEYTLYPLCYEEMVKQHGQITEDRLIPHRLTYGYYPEVVTTSGNKREILNLLADSYLFKDLFLLEQVKKPPLLGKIIRALAFQVGQEVSYNEIGKLVDADRQTVEKYIDLLEKAFIIFRLPALKRNLRNEIKRGMKIYFVDNGILNSVIGNLNELSMRGDVGALWENYVISERRKHLANHLFYANCYFWRTVQQQEIDYIEEIDGRFYAYEVKWNPAKIAKFNRIFLDTYQVESSQTINPQTLGKWLS